jgi:uroporphyrinogen-III decarboxylase
MTSRERFLAVLRGQIPDRVPATLFIQDQGHFLTQVYPDVDPWDYEQNQRNVIEIQKQLGLDVFVRMLFGLNDPLSIHMGGLNVSRSTENWEVTTQVRQRENTRIERNTIHTPAGTLTQEMSYHEIRPGTLLYCCTEKPVKSPADLDVAIRYEPGMPDSWPAEARQKVQQLKAELGDAGILGSWSPHGPFNNASLLVDLETLYSLFLTDIEFYDKLMNFAMNRILDYTRAIDEAGVDVHCVGGNVPGGFLGKSAYDRYVLPYEKRYIDFIQQNGTPAVYHNCGQIMDLAESYKDLGVQVVEPFSPPPLGDADLAEVIRIVDGAYVIIGNIDQVNVLQNGTVDEVKRETEQAIKIGKPGGKFILQSADFLEYGTPMDNLEAYVLTAKQFCGY